MRKITLQQGSKEWEEWRRKIVTSTDAAAILGKCRYHTEYQKWEKKVGLGDETKINPAMQRGIRHEPIARDLFIKEYGIEMVPCCIQSDVNNFIGASLDGLSNCGKYILEIKSQPPVKTIPEDHLCQMEHALLSSDYEAKSGFYVSHWNGVNHVIEMKFNADWESIYIFKAKEFYLRCINFDPPPMTDRDYRVIVDMNVHNMVNEYRQASKQRKYYENLEESIRKGIISECKGKSSMCNGLKISKFPRRGNIDYCKIPELKGIDLDPYRKPTTDQWRLSYGDTT